MLVWNSTQSSIIKMLQNQHFTRVSEHLIYTATVVLSLYSQFVCILSGILVRREGTSSQGDSRPHPGEWNKTAQNCMNRAIVIGLVGSRSKRRYKVRLETGSELYSPSLAARSPRTRGTGGRWLPRDAGSATCRHGNYHIIWNKTQHSPVNMAMVIAINALSALVNHFTVTACRIYIFCLQHFSPTNSPGTCQTTAVYTNSLLSRW